MARAASSARLQSRGSTGFARGSGPALACLVVTLGLACGAPQACAAADAPSPQEVGPLFETVTLQGRVVWLEDALQRQFDLRQDPDAARKTVALETPDGQIWLILKDSRGRAFHQDEALLGKPMEILVRRFRRSPVVQVVRVYLIKGDEQGRDVKYELDYWCDICSIVMYERKPCECCQGPVRIRLRRVPPSDDCRIDPPP